MSKVISELTVKAEWRCDATSCNNKVYASFDPSDDVGHFHASDVITYEALAHGWTFYASRGQRHYCPHHEPRAGHSMTPNTGRLDARDIAQIEATSYEIDWNYDR